MSEYQYKNKGVSNLHDLYLKYKDEVGSGAGIYGVFWKAFEPSIPEYLHRLDQRPDIIEKIKTFVAQLLEAFEEENENSTRET